MIRLIYLGYYFSKMNWSMYSKFLTYTSKKTYKSKALLFLKSVFNSLRHNISPLEYFQFRFFEKPFTEKFGWAGTGFMYEYQLKMNPKNERHILDDKRLFAKEYGEYMIHQVDDIESLESNPSRVKKLLSNTSGKIVFKSADGKCGAQVLIVNASEYNGEKLINFLKNSEYDLVEEYIIQHSEINKLSPAAVNTVRIFTQINQKNEIEILGCRLRISVDSLVDNLAAGNLAAPIDVTSGIISGPAVYSDPTKNEETIHPITKINIVGFQIPFWNECLSLVEAAALKHPQNRSIGWDIVITDSGPGLIEGNHDWCKLLWQLPVKKGLKKLLVNY